MTLAPRLLLYMLLVSLVVAPVAAIGTTITVTGANGAPAPDQDTCAQNGQDATASSSGPDATNEARATGGNGGAGNCAGDGGNATASATSTTAATTTAIATAIGGNGGAT